MVGHLLNLVALDLCLLVLGILSNLGGHVAEFYQLVPAGQAFHLVLEVHAGCRARRYMGGQTHSAVTKSWNCRVQTVSGQ